MVRRTICFSLIYVLSGCGSDSVKSTNVDADSSQEEVPGVDQSIDPEELALTDSSCYKGDAFSCAVEKEIVRLTNTKRTRLPALVYDIKIGFVARDWSKKQSTKGLSTNGFPADREIVYWNEFKKTINFYGETVAYIPNCSSMPAAMLAAKFVETWSNNARTLTMFKGNYKNAGAGLFKTTDGKCYATQQFSR